MARRIGWILVFIAVAANAQTPRRQVNEDCKNDANLGFTALGGKVSAFGGGMGLNLCSEAERNRWALSAAGSITRVGESGNEPATTVQNRNLEAGHEYHFTKPLFTVMRVEYEMNTAQGLESRVVLAPGVGTEIRPQWGSVAFETGLQRNWENVRGEPRKAFPEGWLRASLGWMIRPNVIFGQKLEFDGNTNNRRDYRYKTDTSLRVRLTEKLSLKTGYKTSWDRTPAKGFSRSVWTTDTALVIQWGEGRRRQ
jgi:putative salt-induced outer membrane protein YdiY